MIGLTGYRLPNLHQITILWKRQRDPLSLLTSATTLAGNSIFLPQDPTKWKINEGVWLRRYCPKSMIILRRKCIVPNSATKKTLMPITSLHQTIRWGILYGWTLKIGKGHDLRQSWIIDDIARSRLHARFPLIPTGWNFTHRCRYIPSFMCPYLSQQHRIHFRDKDMRRCPQWKSMARKNGSWTPSSIRGYTNDNCSPLSNGPDSITRIGSQQRVSTNLKRSLDSTNNTPTSVDHSSNASRELSDSRGILSQCRSRPLEGLSLLAHSACMFGRIGFACVFFLRVRKD